MNTRERKANPEALTLQQLEILQRHTVEGKSQEQVARELGISRDTVKRVKRKPAYHELAQAALETKGYTVDTLVEDLIAKTTATKSENIGGSVIEIEDNVSQMKALDQIAKIYGVHSPQSINLNTTNAASELELLEELDEQLAAHAAGASHAASINQAETIEPGPDVAQ